METIGQRIKRLRTEKNLTLQHLSKKTSIPLSTLREWEVGRQIKGEPYEKIAQVLNVGLSELLYGKKPNSREVLIKVHEIEVACKEIRDSLLSFE